MKEKFSIRRTTNSRRRGEAQTIYTSERDKNNIASSGELLPDGAFIEPVGHTLDRERLKLLLWNGTQATVADQVKHRGRIYVPAEIDPTLLQAMWLPKNTAAFGSTRELVTGMSGVLREFSGLGEVSVTVLSRFVLSSWLARSLSVAPWLSIVGPDTNLGTQLLRVLHCFCRHALLLTDVTLGGVYSLPLPFGFTFLVNQPVLGRQVERLLRAARNRGDHIVRNGRLRQVYGPIASYSQVPPNFTRAVAGVEIPAIPARSRLPKLDSDTEKMIAEEFQGKLLGYFLANFHKVRNSKIDTPGLTDSMCELAQSLVACTPDDRRLQREVIEALKIQDAATRPAKWGDVDGVVVEALLFLCHDGKSDRAYLAEIATTAQQLLGARRELVRLTPRALGEKLRFLGLMAEPRDSRGYFLLLTQAICRRVHDLARAYDVPTLQNGVVRCDYCRGVKNGGVAATRKQTGKVR